MIAIAKPESLGNEHLVPIINMSHTKRSVPEWRAVAKKRNRPNGSSLWNRLGGNLEKFIGSLNGCLGDYAQPSRNWNVKSLFVAAASGESGDD